MDIAEDKFYRAKIVQRADFASDLWMIRVNPGGAFTFKPGQYATLGVQTEIKRSERAYSIVSSPLESELEKFTSDRPLPLLAWRRALFAAGKPG